LTIVALDGESMDMGAFDFFSDISNSNYSRLTDEQKKNRKILRDAMCEAGVDGIDSEWWHFTLKNEPYFGYAL